MSGLRLVAYDRHIGAFFIKRGDGGLPQMAGSTEMEMTVLRSHATRSGLFSQSFCQLCLCVTSWPLAPSVGRLRREQTPPQTHRHFSYARLCTRPPLTGKQSFIIGKQRARSVGWNGQFWCLPRARSVSGVVCLLWRMRAQLDAAVLR